MSKLSPPGISIYLNIAENTHKKDSTKYKAMCVLTSLCLSLFYPQKNSAQIKTSVEFELSYLFYFYSVILLIFSCSPVEKGNEMLNCWKGVETEVAFFECFV